MAEYLDLLNSIGGTEGIAELASSVKDLASGFLKDKTGTRIATASAIIEATPPVVMDSIGTLDSLFKWRNIISIVLIIWALGLIVSNIVVTEPETKEKIKYTNSVLLGDGGVMPLIFTMWVAILVLTTMIPMFIAITPKIDELFTNINTIIRVMISGK